MTFIISYGMYIQYDNESNPFKGIGIIENFTYAYHTLEIQIVFISYLPNFNNLEATKKGTI